MRHRDLTWIITLVACLGCGGRSASYDASVEGTVTLDGELAARGRVVFHPVDEGPPAYGSIFPNGTYSLRVGQGNLEKVDGGKIRSGEYIVTVVVNMPSVKDEAVGEGGPPKPGARLSAQKYADEATSDLRVTVKPGRNVLPLELEGAKAEGVRDRARGGPVTGVGAVKPLGKKVGAWRGLLLVAMVTLLSGCGKYESSVSGVITLDGAPVPRGTVKFIPEQSGPSAYGLIGSDGSYAIMTGREAGLKSGPYVVTVVVNEESTPNPDPSLPPKPGKPITPPWYRNQALSPLKYTVEKGSNKINLELSTKRPAR